WNRQQAYFRIRIHRTTQYAKASVSLKLTDRPLTGRISSRPSRDSDLFSRPLRHGPEDLFHDAGGVVNFDEGVTVLAALALVGHDKCGRSWIRTARLRRTGRSDRSL